MNAAQDTPSLSGPYLEAADGSVFPLEPGKFVLGRDPSCGIQLNDATVSKKHCALTVSEHDVSVTDLGSRNHSFVNQTCLRQGQSSRLHHGDRLILGNIMLTFLHPQRARREAPQRPPPRSPGLRAPDSESTLVSFDVSAPSAGIGEQPFSESAFRELRRANERLSVFYDFGRDVGNILDIDQLLRKVARRIMKLIPADSGVLFLKRLGECEPFLYWTREGFQDVSDATFSRTALTMAIRQKRGLFLQDIPSQPDLRTAESVRQFGIQATILVPILLETEVFGALALSSFGRHAEFGPDDFAMISGIAGQIAVALKNAHLADEIERTTAEKVRLEREIEIAAHVQKSILPAASPSLPGLDIAGVSIPAREVGGDFFDYVPLGANSLGATIADVSGKGLAAALLTHQSRNVIHTLARGNPSPADVLQKANSVIYDDYCRAEMFLSAFYGILDTAAETLRYASAGHNPPLLVRADGSCSSLEPTGGLLGISPDLSLSEQSVNLAAADVLALYTDGVSEARDPDRTEFGCQRLAERLGEYRDLPAHEIADRIVREVTSLPGPRFDDATLVVIKVKSE